MTAIDEAELRKVQSQLDWLPQRFRELRENAGFTQKQVANAMGVDHRRVWDLEAGRFDPKWSTICRMALALAIPLDDWIVSCPRTNYRGLPKAAKGKEYDYIVKILDSAKLDAAQWKDIEKLAKEKRLALG